MLTSVRCARNSPKRGAGQRAPVKIASANIETQCKRNPGIQAFAQKYALGASVVNVFIVLKNALER
eukprot:5016103-Alexandrium_andersonii.AAC.1